MGLTSTKRRHEIYRIIYAFKTLYEMAPEAGLSWKNTSERLGPMLTIPPLLPSSTMRVKTLKERSFKCEASKFFNYLPKIVREQKDLNIFKAYLDVYLAELPDQPKGPGETPRCTRSDGKTSNSIRDWANAKANNLNWKPAEDPLNRKRYNFPK